MISPDTILQDVKYGIRTLTRNRWASTITVLSLAVGIGVNTAVFTAYKAFVTRSIDARNPAEIVNLALARDSGAADFRFSNSDYEAYRDSVRAFSGLVAFRPARVTLSNVGGMIDQRTAIRGSAFGRLGLLTAGAGNAEFAQVFVVSENYFAVLGVPALRGRTFETGKIPGPPADPSVLISANYWQRRFASDPAIVGKTVHLNGVAFTVIGVSPYNFTGTEVMAPAFWIPLSMEPQINADPNWLHERENRRYRLAGRLAPGVTIDQARAQTAVLADHLRKLSNSKTEPAKPVTVLIWPGSPFPLPLSYYAGLNFAILLIMAGAALVLAVAAANAGSLQLAQIRSRETEMRTRLSLGATRFRVMRQLLTESVLIGLLAGVFALLFSWAFLKLAVKAFVEAMPVEFAGFVFDVDPSFAIFAYLSLISLIAGILAGLTPAIQSTSSALASTPRSSTVSLRGRRLQDLLVAVQVAFSLVLMITGSMFVRGSMNALDIETGYDTKRLAQLDFQFPKAPSYSDDRKIAFVNELRLRMSTLPGVIHVTSGRPPGSSVRTAVAPMDSGPGLAGARSIVHYTYVQGNYFETLGIPLSAGRSFDRRNQNEQSVVLSESAAKQIWPNSNPIGRRLRLGAIDERFYSSTELVADGAAYLVVGVARDTRGAEFDGSDSKQIYLPLLDARLADRPLIIRTRANALQLLPVIDRVITSIDSQIVASSSTLEDSLRRAPSFGISVMAAAIASCMGSLGLLLAVIGIFGTVSHIVALRTREVGIRMAMGAQRHDVMRLILGESSRPVVAGLAVGMILAVGVVYLLRHILYGISSIDGIFFLIISLVFLVVALLAAYPPARRAMRVEPVVALRNE